MDTKEISIIPPKGYEIDKENSTFEKIVFKEKKSKSKPKSWEEYCKLKKESGDIGYTINIDSSINSFSWSNCVQPDGWKNVLPSKEYAEAFFAFMQLISLRKAWVGDWEPDWTDKRSKYIVAYRHNTAHLINSAFGKRPLSFPTKEMALDFLTTFENLLETAQILI